MKHHILALAASCIWGCILLYQLFVPSVRIIVTPEFEISDAFHLSYASKYWYAEKLRSPELPIWSNQIGSGFPVLGEGQTGVFFAPNLVLFSTLPVPIAYNLSLLVCIVFACWGTYAWLTALKLPFFVAMIGGLTFSASGWMAFHIQHICLLQSFSLLPAVFAATEKLRATGKTQYLFLVGILVAQQLFAGFVQAVFITICTASTYVVLREISDTKKHLFRSLFLWACGITIGILLSSIQFFPMLEFSRLLSVSAGFSLEQATEFSFPPAHFLTYLYPFILGSPRNGTYYTGTYVSHEVFWEAIGYIGIIPILYIVWTFFYKEFRKNALTWYVLISICVLLMLGKYSPIYLVFSAFPFTLFRVPARFVIPLTLVLVTLAALSFVYLKTRWRYTTFILVTLCGIHLLSLVIPWYGYHLTVEPSHIPYFPIPAYTHVPTESYQYAIQTRNQIRREFFTKGWKNPSTSLFLLQDMLPNSNLMTMTATYDAYPSRTLSLVHSYNELLNELTKNTTDGLQISTAAAKLFNLSSISTVLTARPLMDPVPFEQKSIQKNKETTLIRYANPHALPVMHVSCRPLFLSSLDELLTIVKNPSYDEQNHVLLSSENKKYFPPTQASHATCNTTIQTIQNQDLSQEYRIVNNESFPVVAVQTFTKYPGWTAYVDDKEARILTANIRYRGVIIPPGSHTLVIKNTSQSLSYGMYVTFATAASISCVLIYLMQRKKLW